MRNKDWKRRGGRIRKRIEGKGWKRREGEEEDNEGWGIKIGRGSWEK